MSLNNIKQTDEVVTVAKAISSRSMVGIATTTLPETGPTLPVTTFTK
jgi:hypothetical protein